MSRRLSELKAFLRYMNNADDKDASGKDWRDLIYRTTQSDIASVCDRHHGRRVVVAEPARKSASKYTQSPGLTRTITRRDLLLTLFSPAGEL